MAAVSGQIGAGQLSGGGGYPPSDSPAARSKWFRSTGNSAPSL